MIVSHISLSYSFFLTRCALFFDTDDVVCCKLSGNDHAENIFFVSSFRINYAINFISS